MSVWCLISEFSVSRLDLTLTISASVVEAGSSTQDVIDAVYDCEIESKRTNALEVEKRIDFGDENCILCMHFPVAP
jgi:hypothetical protein